MEKEKNIFNADHPARKKAIELIKSVPCLDKLNGKEYYEAEDLITTAIAKESKKNN